ncbi:hypothetical protein HK102_011928 [Quaeritorhiza haematococci]|nr:hypothetical protein HK102_011928 [Quaeritorhiza haematococci]
MLRNLSSTYGVVRVADSNTAVKTERKGFQTEGLVDVLHKRRNGKIVKEKTQSNSTPRTPKSSFALDLTEEQKKARAQVALPYFDAQQQEQQKVETLAANNNMGGGSGGGVVVTGASVVTTFPSDDEDDEWDEDPDGDLDI